MTDEASEGPEVAARHVAALAHPMRNLGEALRAMSPRMVITCGRGSSDHATTYAKYIIETRLGVPVASHAPSVSSIYGTTWRDLSGVMFLAISQSGRSPDLVLSAQAARAAGAYVVSLINVAHSPLAEASDLALPLLAGPEASVAATKSFIASLLAIARLTAEWGADDKLTNALEAAPALLSSALTFDWSAALAPLRDASGLFVIGRGLGLAAAQEAALKLKETCGLHAEAVSAAEIRHGPMAIVGPRFSVLLLTSTDEAADAFAPLAADFVARGATVLAAGTPIARTVGLPTADAPHPALAPIAIIQSFYGFAARLALMRGLDPDRPAHLTKVTETR